MQLKALFMLTRPINTFIASCAVLLAAIMTHEINHNILLAIASVAFISSGGHAINDYFDFEIDKINKPDRPLPSKQVSLKQAYYFSLITFVIGCAISYFINLPCFIIAMCASVLLYYYAKFLKNSGFPGNLTIAGLTGMALIYGGISVAGLEKIIFAAFFAFCINLGREIIKDVEDYEGDKVCGAKTLAIRFGIKKALIAGALPLIGIIISTPVPFLLNIYNYYYVAIMILGVDIPLVYSIALIVRTPTSHSAERVKKIIKTVIVIGIVGLYIGVFKV
ncbi:MAG: UbiA family prenyltransferase [Candidatus Methanofastidiosia archaeon]